MTSSTDSLWSIKPLPLLFHTRVLDTSHWTTFPDEEIVEGIARSLMAEGVLKRKEKKRRIVGAYLGNRLDAIANKTYDPVCWFFGNPCKTDRELLYDYMRFFASRGKKLSISKKLSIGWILTDFLQNSYPLGSYVLMKFVDNIDSNSLITDKYDENERILEITIKDVGYRVIGDVHLEDSEVVFPPLEKEKTKAFKLPPLKVPLNLFNEIKKSAPGIKKPLSTILQAYSSSPEYKDHAEDFLERMLILAGQLRKSTDTCAVGLPVKGFMHDKPVLFGILWLVYDSPWSVIKEDEEPIIRSILSNILYPFAGKLQTFLLSLQTRKLRETEERIAAAAIMARNISHNIGSHVLPKAEIGNVREKLEKVYSWKRSDGKVITPMPLNICGMIEGIKTRLDRYIQYKSDFLAEITTEPLYSIRNARFFQDVMATFLGNTLLIDNIAAMEGLGYKKKWCVDWEKWPEEQKQREKFNEFPRATLRIRCFREENALKREYKSLFQKADGETAYFYDNVFVPYGWRDIESNNENIVFVGLREGSPQDIEIALPGPMGEFAFYGFLENIIRNAAKHNKERIQKLRDQVHKFALEIHVEIKDDPENFDDYYRLRIYDNVSEPEPENAAENLLCSKLQKYLEKDLVDDTGHPRREAWGLAEMMICANLLAGTKSFKYEKKNLSVECEDVSNGNGKGANRLVYYLRLMKPKKVALIGLSLFRDIPRQKQADYKKNGIRFFESLKAFGDAVSQPTSSIAAFDFALISKDEVNSLKQYRHLLPFRILQIDPTSAGKLPEVTSEGDLFVAEEDVLSDLNTDSEKFIHNLWQVWLQRWNQSNRKDKMPCAGLDVYLGQKGDTFPTTLWKDKIEDLIKEPHSTLPIRLWGQNKSVVSIITGDKDKVPASRVLFDRHGELLDKTKKLTDQDAYIMLDKLSPDFSKVFQPPASDPWVFPYELIEAGLLRVLILDERVAERAVKSIRSSDADVDKIASCLVGKYGFNPAYWHVAKRSRVLIGTHLLFSPDGETSHDDDKNSVLKGAIHAQSFNDQYDRYIADDKNSDENMKSTCPKLCLDVSDKKVDIFINPTGRESDGESARPLEEYGIDILLIHQGIIDNLPDSWSKENKFIKRLRKFIPWVIVESGRGIPPEVQKSKEKFLPFSVVDHWLDGARVGKLSLAQTVMTLIRNKKQ